METGIVSFEFQGQKYNIEYPDLKLDDSTSWADVRERMNDIPFEYAYWSAVLASLNQRIKEMEIEFEGWYAEAYAEATKDMPKSASEGAKKQRLLVAHYESYKGHQVEIAKLAAVASKVGTFVRAIDMQLRSLQTIGSALKAEMNMTPGAGFRGE